jgi:hypothetical protein
VRAFVVRCQIFGVLSSLRLDEAGLYKLVVVINEDEETRKEVSFKITAAGTRVVH